MALAEAPSTLKLSSILSGLSYALDLTEGHPRGHASRSCLIGMRIGRALGLSQFFVSVVIVAIVGNAAEHGGSVVVARRGNMRLASEIAVSSTAQVAVFVTPAIVLVSCLVGRGLPLSFRAVELATMALATVAVAAVAVRGRSQRWHGVTLMGAYVAVAVWYGLAGDR